MGKVFEKLFNKENDEFVELFKFGIRRDVPDNTLTTIKPKKCDSLIPAFGKGLKAAMDNGMRGIKACNNIAITSRVIVAKPFASIITNATFSYCLKCFKENVNFFECEECERVFYCSSDCYHADRTHQYECGTHFQEIGNHYVKCCIQMILESMSIFENYEELMNYAVEAMEKTDIGEFNARGTWMDKESQFSTIMKLQSADFSESQDEKRNEARSYVKEAFEQCMQMEILKSYFNGNFNTRPNQEDMEIETSGPETEESEDESESDDEPMKMDENDSKLSNGERFLQHLISHFMGVLSINAFEGKKNNSDAMYIYDVLSLLNHSCAPNLSNFFDGNTMISKYPEWKASLHELSQSRRTPRDNS